MTSIRGKLLAGLLALALLAVGGMAAGGYTVLRLSAVSDAHRAFALAKRQLDEAIRQRYRLIEQIADLSYLSPVIRSVTGAADESDFGLSSADADAQNLDKLHKNLVDSDWTWSAAAGEGTFAVADYKGRILYAYASPGTWGGDAAALPAVRDALAGTMGHLGSMVVRADDPRLVALGLVRPGESGLRVVLARAEVLGGRAQACFIQVAEARSLVRGVALEGILLSLVAPDGFRDGAVPGPVIDEARAAGVAIEADAAGSRWLAQSFPLPGLAEGSTVATVVVAADLGAALARTLGPALPLLWAFAIALVLLALAGALVLSRRFSRPIVALEAAARRVADGNLDVSVAAGEGGDEIDRLGVAFNRMTEGLRERERIKTTFKKYLAPDVVEYLLAHPDAQRLGGTRKDLTVMFADLVRFTSLAEGRPPEEVVDILNTYFTRVSERIAARGGVVDKYIGDAVMAFFGAPLPAPDHPLRACRAALDHLVVLDELAPRWRSGAWPPLEVRIGISRGEMIIGNIGGGQAQDYTVIGDAVNLAERIEGVNREYRTRLLVAEAVWTDVRGELDGREVDLVGLLGRSAPVRIFEIFGEKGSLGDARRACIDRYAEGLAALRARRFAEASERFRAAAAADPADGPAPVMAERAERYAREPPAADWDTVYRVLSK